MIDFSKTIPVNSDITITHRLPWQLGTHEDGFLTGLDNLILVSITIKFLKPRIPEKIAVIILKFETM